MAINEDRINELNRKYPMVCECRSKSTSTLDALPSYEYLRNLRDDIPEELYAFWFRELLKFNTAKVSDELRLEMFEGVKRENIMYQEELDALKSFDDVITVYRGASADEDPPGICWSLKKYVAEEYFEGHDDVLFVADVSKKDILAYFSKNNIEEEIIVKVEKDYKKIFID